MRSNVVPVVSVARRPALPAERHSVARFARLGRSRKTAPGLFLVVFPALILAMGCAVPSAPVYVGSVQFVRASDFDEVRGVNAPGDVSGTASPRTSAEVEPPKGSGAVPGKIVAPARPEGPSAPAEDSPGSGNAAK